MNIAVAYDNGQIAGNLGSCKTFLIVTVEGKEPTGKRLAAVDGEGTTALLKLASLEKLDVLICGSLGLAIRNALEMIGILLVPGCEGSPEEAVAKFIVGEKQGDPTLLEIGREEDPDDPMACMHDCAKCAGCGPIELLKQIPVEEIKYVAKMLKQHPGWGAFFVTARMDKNGKKFYYLVWIQTK